MNSPSRLRVLYERAGVRSGVSAIRRLTQSMHDQSYVTTPPFRSDIFCRQARVTVRSIPLQNCDGRLTFLGDRFIAEVSSKHSIERRRFSICHEIGHTFFVDTATHSNAIAGSCEMSEWGRWYEEKLCNLAAAELLMPRAAFLRVARQYRPCLENLRQVAGIFLTSRSATLTRCLELDVWPVITFKVVPVDCRDYERGFAIRYWSSAQSALKGPTGQSIAVSWLAKELRSMDFLKSSGLLDAYLREAKWDLSVFVPGLEKRLRMETDSKGHPSRSTINILIYSDN